MSLSRVIYAVLSVAGLGVMFGIGLAFTSKILSVKKNELVAKLEDVLPGLNCGTCGFAGCSSYAEALAERNQGEEDQEQVSLTLCLPGGQEVAEKLALLMGEEVSASFEKKVAQVFCRGNRDRAATSFIYSGVSDCNALHVMYGGDKSCPFGCLGLGSCIKVCPVDAIAYDGKGLVRVDREKCISCGKCIDICPTGVMKFIPYHADYLVACSSTDKGGVTKKYCSVGCIGCKLCERKSPEGGFKVDNFLATIDYTAQGDREEAAKACPPKCIVLNGLVNDVK